jgi:hypothetical protein
MMVPHEDKPVVIQPTPVVIQNPWAKSMVDINTAITMGWIMFVIIFVMIIISILFKITNGMDKI